MSLPAFPDDIKTAPLPVIDYSKLVDGDVGECKRMFQACKDAGFFYLANHQVESDSMYDLAEKIFDLPLEEKLKYDMGATGNYYGYKGHGAMVVDRDGRRDANEFYNISKNDVVCIAQRPLEQPAPVHSATTLRSFIESSHQVATTILQVLSTQLCLESGYFPSMHRIDQLSGDQVRMVKAPPRPQLTDIQASLGEHTDFGSVTVLFNRLGGLQILQEEWTYVKPVKGLAIVNMGDAMVKLTNGMLKSAMHRVVQPPGEQAKETRYSVVYFVRPEDDVLLQPPKFLQSEEQAVTESPVTASAWIANRVKNLMAANYKSAETWNASRGTEATSGPKPVSV